jgi:hypothetical protein
MFSKLFIYWLPQIKQQRNNFSISTSSTISFFFFTSLNQWINMSLVFLLRKISLNSHQNRNQINIKEWVNEWDFFDFNLNHCRLCIFSLYQLHYCWSEFVNHSIAMAITTPVWLSIAAIQLFRLNLFFFLSHNSPLFSTHFNFADPFIMFHFSTHSSSLSILFIYINFPTTMILLFKCHKFWWAPVFFLGYSCMCASVQLTGYQNKIYKNKES